jgi:hypothetical protein
MSQDGETGVAGGSPLGPLDDLEDLPVHDHVARFEAVHETLVARLEGSQDVSAGRAGA